MNYILFLLTLFASIGFFNYHGIFQLPVIKALLYLMIGISMVLALTERNASLRDVIYPRKAYWTVIGGIVISILTATFIHGQPLTISIVATLPYLLTYLYFFILMKQQIPTKKILATIMVLTAISIPVYFMNVMTFPHNIFGEELNEDLSRGVLRVPIVAIELMVLVFMFSIGKWNVTRRAIWLIVVGVTGLMIIMSLIRQIIAVAGLLGVFFLLKKVKWVTKIFWLGVLAAIAIFVLPQLTIYQGMRDLSEEQIDDNDNDEDVRIKAWKMYTYEGWDNPFTTLFGNGIPALSSSAYGARVDAERDTTLCFPEDVGWAGFSNYFGLVTTIALMILLAKTIFKHKPPEKEYLTYWFIFIFLTSIASGPILYYNQILGISIALYLVYTPLDEENCVNHPQLQ